MTINKLFVLIIILAIPMLISAQKGGHLEWSFLTLPDSLISGADELVREEKRTLELLAPDKAVLRVRKVVTLLNNAGTSDLLYLFYDENTKVKKIKGTIYDKLGNFVRKIKNDEIKDQSAVSSFSLYEDDRVQLVDVVHKDYPYTIVWEYEQELSGIQMISQLRWDVQQYFQGIQKASLHLIFPEEMKVNYRTLNFSTTPIATKEKGKTELLWIVSNRKPIAKEPFSPPSFQVLPKVLMSLSNFEISGYQGSMASWEAYGQFLNKLYDGRDNLPEEVTEEIRVLLEGVTDTEKRIEILYRYLQEKVRYVSVQLGIGGWQPFDAQYVAQNNYGDCKALSNYMKTLLAKAGIESYPVIIENGTLTYPIEPDFVFPGFNHVILYVPEVDYWLECTSSSSPVNYIGANNMDRDVLLVTPKGGKLKRTPVQHPEDNQEIIKAKMVIEASGNSSVEYQGSLLGARHEKFRALIHNSSEQEQKEWLLKRYIPLSNLEMKSYDIQVEKGRPNATLSYQGKVRKFAAKAGKRLFIPLNQVSVYGNIPSESAQRKQAVYHNKAISEQLEIELVLPEGYELESAPFDTLAFSSAFGSYEARLKKEDNRLVFKRIVKFFPITKPAAFYEEMRSFYKEVARYESAKMVAVEKKT